MTRWKWTAVMLCCAIWCMPMEGLAGTIPPAPPVGPQIVINPNYDLVVTKTATLDLTSSGYGVVSFVGVPLNSFDFGGTLGVQNVAITDTIICRSSGGTLSSSTDSFTTAINVAAICLRTEQIIDLGAGPNYYYASLGSGGSTGSMTIVGDGTWTNNFSFDVDIHLGSKTGPVVMSGLPFSLNGSGYWDRTPGPYYPEIMAAITNDPESDGEFFLKGIAHHVAPDKIHDVIDLSCVPEPSTGLLLLAGGLAVVWRTRRSRLAA